MRETTDNSKAGGRCAPAPGSERLLLAMDRLMEIVEGVKLQRWHANGRRLVDTPEWCEVYVAWCAINRMPPNGKAHAQPR